SVDAPAITLEKSAGGVGAHQLRACLEQRRWRRRFHLGDAHARRGYLSDPRGMAHNHTMRVTVLGTGAMGAGMAQSLLRAAFDVTVWNRTVARSEPLADDGATVALDPVAAVADADLVMAMLFDAASTVDVMETVLPHMQQEAVFVQCATV